jgi:hypothetical protein
MTNKKSDCEDISGWREKRKKDEKTSNGAG